MINLHFSDQKTDLEYMEEELLPILFLKTIILMELIFLKLEPPTVLQVTDLSGMLNMKPLL